MSGAGQVGHAAGQHSAVRYQPVVPEQILPPIFRCLQVKFSNIGAFTAGGGGREEDTELLAVC